MGGLAPKRARKVPKAACQATAVKSSSSCALFGKPLHLTAEPQFPHPAQNHGNSRFGIHARPEPGFPFLSLITISSLALLWDPNLSENFRALGPSLGEASPSKNFKPRRTPQGQLESPQREVPSWGTVNSFVNPWGWLLRTVSLHPMQCPHSSKDQRGR